MRESTPASVFFLLVLRRLFALLNFLSVVLKEVFSENAAARGTGIQKGKNESGR